MTTAKKSGTAKKSRARKNRTAAAQRTATKPDAGCDEATHDAHPEDPTDSSVLHASSTDSATGEGGYPSGEYDVTKPDTCEKPVTKGPIEMILDQRFEGTNVKELLKQAEDNARLRPKQFDLAVESLPVGTLIEHEAPNRWRVHVVGQNRYGHGGTHSEAVESYILGEEGGSEEEAAARRFAKLPPEQQAEIEERDRKAAERVGGEPPENFAREEAKKIASADAKADVPAPNAATDGPEKASARAEEGAKDAQDAPSAPTPATGPEPTEP